MLVSNKGLELIKSYEGYSPTVYVCPAGYPTIGYGHRVLDHEQALYRNVSLSVTQAEELLQRDLEPVYRAIKEMVLVPLAQGQFDALASFIFNLGATRFFNSTLRKLINRGNYAGASLEFPKWVYANRKVLQGLVKRRNAEQALFMDV